MLNLYFIANFADESTAKGVYIHQGKKVMMK